MKLFIARHGEASFDADTDFSRPLTQRGIDQTRVLADQNLSTLNEVRSIWASPLLRAQQTAKIYQEILELDIHTQPFITPDSSPKQVLRQLSKANLDSLLIVSHQPLVGDLVSLLVEGNCFQPHPFVTSELVVLECDMFEPGLSHLIKDIIPV
jgi:phosphohistidine phosphatase